MTQSRRKSLVDQPGNQYMEDGRDVVTDDEELLKDAIFRHGGSWNLADANCDVYRYHAFTDIKQGAHFHRIPYRDAVNFLLSYHRSKYPRGR